MPYIFETLSVLPYDLSMMGNKFVLLKVILAIWNFTRDVNESSYSNSTWRVLEFDLGLIELSSSLSILSS